MKRKKKIPKDSFNDDKLKNYIENEFPMIGEVLLPNGFSSAFMGISTTDETPRLVYDAMKIISILMKRDEMTYEEAIEYFEYNIAGYKSASGNHPIYVHIIPPDWEKN